MQILLWALILIATGVYISGPIVDPDLWWHLTVGRWIVAHGEIPSVDYWNMFALGEPWRAYSWLSEIVVALVDGRFGPHGLLTLKFILAGSLGLSLGLAFRAIARDGFLGALLGVFATLACHNHFTLRPQSLVWIFFALLLALADRIETEGLSRRRAVWLALLMCLWANTHITTVLGIGALALWLFNGLGSIGLVVRACGVAFLGTLITPYFGGEWLTFLSKTGHPLQMQAIAEFAPATIMQHSTAFLVIIVGLFGAFALRRPNLIEPGKIILAGGFTIAGLAVVKFLPFAVLVWCGLVAVMWRRTRGEPAILGNLAEGLERLRRLVGALPYEGLSFLVICTMIVNIYNVWPEPVSRTIVPLEAVDFIEQHRLAHPILNDFGRGGYMMYRLSGADGSIQHPVPIDGRTNVTPKDVWEKAHASFQGSARWEEYLKLVKPETILWKSESPLISILEARGDWCVVFRRGSVEFGYVVLIKRTEFEARPGEFSSPACEPAARSGAEGGDAPADARS
jgi:hypothetical protein